MSRYRRTDMDLAYGDPPPPPQAERWDASRFSRESQFRRAPVIEQRPPYESQRRGGPGYHEEDQYYSDRRESGPGGFRERRFFEEDDYYDPRANAGAMVPFRSERPPRPAAPARPTMIRRQSSVDRFDFDRRQDRRQYDDRYDDYRPPPPPPREARNSRYDIRIYDDVKVQDPDQYGDDGFREYKEREWTRSRTRNDSPSPDRRAPSRAATASEIIVADTPVTYREEIIREEKVVEKPYPRRGKTRMPKRLVHTKVLYDLGYSYYEEDDKTILIEKALGPDNIDEVFAKSKEYRERETITTQLIEALPPAPASVRAPPSEAPRSVRDWDNFAALERSPSPGSSVSQSTRKSHRRARSQAASRVSRRPSTHQSVHEDIHRTERESRHGSIVHESVHESIHRDVHGSRSPSPAPTARTGRSSRRSRSYGRSRRSRSSSDRSGTTIIERKVVKTENIEESNPVNIGMLELVPSKSKSRTDAAIREEINRLERERRDLRRDTDVIRYERRRRDSSPLGILREPSPRGEVIISDRREGEVVAVRKDKRARSKSRPPGPGLLKGLMYTVT